MSVSLAGMLSPFILGAALGWYFHGSTDLFPANSTRWASATFPGASMCITAFPMLARIIHFKGLTGTRMGTVAIGAGAIDDACAWCLPAVVLSSLEGSPTAALRSIGGGILFVLFVTMIIRPLLKKLEDRLVSDGRLTEPGLVICLALMALGAFTTDRLGLHAVFGGFLMGTAIPRGVMVKDASARTEPLTVALLLPLFFTFSGLNTRIGLLNTPEGWLMSLLVLMVAMLVIMAIVTTLSPRRGEGGLKPLFTRIGRTSTPLGSRPWLHHVAPSGAQSHLAFQLPTSHFSLLTSHFPLLTSHFSLPTSHFPLPTSHFPLPTSRFPLPTRCLHHARWQCSLPADCRPAAQQGSPRRDCAPLA